jgi:hypothetical protein
VAATVFSSQRFCYHLHLPQLPHARPQNLTYAAFPGSELGAALVQNAVILWVIPSNTQL